MFEHICVSKACGITSMDLVIRSLQSMIQIPCEGTVFRISNTMLIIQKLVQPHILSSYQGSFHLGKIEKLNKNDKCPKCPNWILWNGMLGVELVNSFPGYHHAVMVSS